MAVKSQYNSKKWIQSTIQPKIISKEGTKTLEVLVINKVNEIEDPMEALHEGLGLMNAGGTHGEPIDPIMVVETPQQVFDRKMANIKALVKDKSLTDVEANKMRKELVMKH
tara:strand:+ start:237 stop:569 length:333 start_codon:yes stop_codon:yes gene_type:complete